MYLQIVSIKCLGKSDDIVLILIVAIQEKSALDYLFSPQFPKDVEKSIRDFCKKFWNGYNFITHSFMHQTMENSNTCTYGGMGNQYESAVSVKQSIETRLCRKSVFHFKRQTWP